MRILNPRWIIHIPLILMLSACGGAKATQTPVNSNAIYTAAVQTAFAIISQTAAVVTPTPTITPLPSESPTIGPSKTPLITDTPGTPLPTNTPLVIGTQLPTSAQSCDNAAWISDITIPDFSEMAPGAQFVKTWKVKNNGTCAWTTSYRLVFGWGGEGTNWNTAPPVYMTRVIDPGEEVDISVTLTAPLAAGQYGAHFRMQNNNGFNFGIDLTIIIKISATPTP